MKPVKTRGSVEYFKCKYCDELVRIADTGPGESHGCIVKYVNGVGIPDYYYHLKCWRSKNPS